MNKIKKTVLATAIATITSSSFATVEKQESLGISTDDIVGVFTKIEDFITGLKVTPTKSAQKTSTMGSEFSSVQVTSCLSEAPSMVEARQEIEDMMVKLKVDEFKKNHTTEIKKTAAQKQADLLLLKVTDLLRENKVSTAKVLFENTVDNLQLSFEDQENYRILFESIKGFERNNSLIGEIANVTDMDIKEYIIKQGIDRLLTREAVSDLAFAVATAGIEGDKKHRLLTEINLKANNLTIALVEVTKIKNKTDHDKAILENIVVKLVSMERSLTALIGQ